MARHNRPNVHIQGAFGGRVRVDRLNVAGDRQSDLTVHGGPDKAVYAHLEEHYAFWHEQLGTEKVSKKCPGQTLPVAQ